MNVMIVYDCSETIGLLEALFLQNGYRVYTAADGVAALKYLRTEPIDVIISDMQLPRMDGFQLCRSIQTDETLRHIPCIIYPQACASAQDEVYALNVGAAGFIRELPSPAAFLTRVRTVMEEAKDKAKNKAVTKGKNGEAGEEDSLRLYTEQLAERLELTTTRMEKEVRARHRAEAKLQESEQRLKVVQRLAGIGNFVWNISKEEITWSEELFHLLDYPEDTEINFQWVNAQIHHPDDLPRVQQWLADIQNSDGGEPSALEYRLVRRDGTPIYVHTVAEIKYAEDGKPIVFATIQDISERRQNDLRQKESEERFRRIYEHSGTGLCQVSLDFRVEHTNKAYSDMLGYTPQELEGMHLKDFTHPEGLDENLELQERLRRGEIDHYRMEKKFLHKDGHTIYGLLDANLIQDEDKNPLYFLSSVVDITERRELEQQLLQAQKLESIGRLAGGVAHDYNNMLGVILGSAELALLRVEASDPVYVKLEHIRDAARRSADITRQLLAFARKQVITPRVIDLNSSLSAMLNMLRSLIGEGVELVWMPGKETYPVKIDPIQLDQILANLCVNAQDAINGVGKITIETGRAEFDAEYCACHQGFKPGSYVMLAASDNGCGMDAETRAMIYEPFFTTKETGKGTGLGLPTVYGIVKQNNGFINLYSEPGSGTTFRIYLPRYTEDQVGQSDNTCFPRLDGGHGERILVVEDDPILLELTSMMLEELGYHPLPASDPGQARQKVIEHSSAIMLLMTDIVMPGMNGREFSEELTAQQPELKTLYMSGYSANVIGQHGKLEAGVNFIQKPFSMRELALKLKQVLAG